MGRVRNSSSGTQLVLASFSFWVSRTQIFTLLAWESAVRWKQRARGGKAPLAPPASPDSQAEPQTCPSWLRAVSRAHLGNKTALFWEERLVRVSKSQG